MPAALPRLLADHGFAGVPEDPFPNDGWSGSRLTMLERHHRRVVLKRTSPSLDWIVRATRDTSLREAWVAEGPLDLPEGVVAPYLGVAREGDEAALLMPDLSRHLLSWKEGAPALSVDVVDRVLRRLAELHTAAWWPAHPPPPWCPLDLRLTLLTRRSAARYIADGVAAGARFAAGWDAFDRGAPPAARELVAALTADPAPLIDALARLPAAGLHGDLKLANVALLADEAIGLVDWQMTMRAPVAVELGWLLVSNVALLPEPPDAILARYRAHASDDLAGDWGAQVDLAWLVGLLLRGWRKGLDAEAGVPTGSGDSGADDLARWAAHAVEAAERRL